MARRSCDGAGLLGAFRAAVDNLESHVDEINSLNVYPVPDGDTGSNMLATVRAALDEAERANGGSADRIASAASFGALMGARGNSGVITSQIFRGMAEGLGGKRRFNGLDLAHALSEGTRTAYAAVAKPVEGTILTVIREAAAAAVATATRENDLEAVLAATVDAAEKAVAKTPSLLPILREAGVVDAGGQGLVRLLQGGLLFLLGQLPAATAAARGAALAEAAALVTHPGEGFGYETMYLLQAHPGRSLDVDAVRLHLESIGQSVLVAGDSRAVKVHVHSERPDLVIAFGLGLGSLSRINVDNLDSQTREVRERRASDFTSIEGGTAGRPAAGAGIRAPGGTTPAAEPGPGCRLPLGVVAVAAGEGLCEVFEQFRNPEALALTVVRVGQSSNPSTGELLEAISALPADEIIILPNNPNVVLAARQVVGLADRPVHVVPTRNAAEGVAALVALDEKKDAAANVEEMTRTGRAIQSVAVTEAVRDAKIGDRKVKKGQTIVLDPDDGLVAADGDRNRAILAAIHTLTPGFELVTLYYGDGADLTEAEGVERLIGSALADVDVEIVHGGQPFYRYLISAE